MQKVAGLDIVPCQVQNALELDDCCELVLVQFVRDAKQEVVDTIDDVIEVVDDSWGTGRRNELFEAEARGQEAERKLNCGTHLCRQPVRTLRRRAWRPRQL